MNECTPCRSRMQRPATPSQEQSSTKSLTATRCSTRVLSHFLLHCGLGLKVAQIARLVGISRPTASRPQGLSSKEAIQQARHRLDGRPYGKLLPRYAGPIAQFLCTHSQSTRYD